MISAQGSYDVSANITGQAGADGIRTEASDVTLDLFCHSLLGGQGPDPSRGAAEQVQYRIVSARKVEDLRREIHHVARQGFRLVGSSGAFPAFKQRGLVRVVFERIPEPRTLTRYVVIEDRYGFGKEGLGALREAGDQGYRLTPRGIVLRARNHPLSAYSWMQALLILEKTDSSAPCEYAIVRLSARDSEWAELLARARDGFDVVGLSRGVGVILVRAAGARRRESLSSGHFSMVSSLRRKKLATKLDTAASAGYRVVDVEFGLSKGGSYDLFLERSAEPPETYEYRLLTLKGDLIAQMNEYGAEGFRAHDTVWWLMERMPTNKRVYAYRLVHASPEDGLGDALAEAHAEGYRFVRFAGSDGAVVERILSPIPVER